MNDPTPPSPNLAQARTPQIGQDPTQEAEIRSWLTSRLADLLKINPDDIDTDLPFEQYGLDSEQAVSLSGDLQEWLGRPLDPTLLFDYPTVRGLAEYLASLAPQESEVPSDEK